MPIDVAELLQSRHGENYALHDRHLNHQLARVLKTHRLRPCSTCAARAPTCSTRRAEQYLDFLSGFGVFALGRSHPAMKNALHQAIDADLPNMVQMDCALLPGLLAEELVRAPPATSSRVFFCQLRRRGGRDRPSSSPGGPPRRGRILYCRSRLSRADHRRPGPQRRSRVPRGLRQAAARVRLGSVRRHRGTGARALQKRDVAAFVVEPIQGKGVYLRPTEYWRQAAGAVPQVRNAARDRRGADRHGAHRQVLLPSSTGGPSRTSSPCPRRSPAGSCPVGAMLTTAKVFDSGVQLDGAGHGPLVHLRYATSWPWWPGWPPSHAFDEEDIVDRAPSTGEAVLRTALAAAGRKYEILHEVRGKG